MKLQPLALSKHSELVEVRKTCTYKSKYYNNTHSYRTVVLTSWEFNFSTEILGASTRINTT